MTSEDHGDGLDFDKRFLPTDLQNNRIPTFKTDLEPDVIPMGETHILVQDMTESNNNPVIPYLPASDQYSNGITFPRVLQEIQCGEYLSPSFRGFSGTSGGSASSDTRSTYSSYSDATLNPGSPFQDVLSFVSHSGSVVGATAQSNKSDLEAGSLLPQQLDANFDQEISLGKSFSTKNASQLKVGDRVPQHEQQYPYFASEITEKLYLPSVLEPKEYSLTENNLFNYNENIGATKMYNYNNNGSYHGERDSSEFPVPNPYSYRKTDNSMDTNMLQNENEAVLNASVMISIDQPPDAVAARTRSLFGDSSRNSSTHDLQEKKPSLAYLSHNTAELVSSSGNFLNIGLNNRSYIPPPDTERAAYSLLLKPSDFLGQQSSRSPLGNDSGCQLRSISPSRSGDTSRVSSRSRSRSPQVLNMSEDERDIDEFESNQVESADQTATTSRQRMLELANSHLSKRKQKHPSLFECHLCEKRFTRPYNLKSHLRTHTDERPFLCKICSKAFARQHDRKRHEDLHLGEKKYICKGILRNGTAIGCGKRFARADALRRHFQTELGRACIRLLLEEDEREQDAELVSGIQLPSGKFVNPHKVDAIPGLEEND